MVLGRMGILRSHRIGRAASAAAAMGACLALANCSQTTSFSRVDPKFGVSSSQRVVGFGEPVPKGGGTYRVGKPYVIAGKTYVPEENANYRAEGLASWYGDAFHGRRTANGEVFDMTSLTAAHPTLPIPSYARVTNMRNGKSLIVRVNDRGPYHGNRLIDVSNKAAELLDFKSNGVAQVRVEYVGRASLEGSDDRQLMATLRTGEPAPSPSVVRVASARSFVPDMQGGRAVSRDVPMPEGRPYSLGNTPADRQTSEISSSGRYRSAAAYPAENRRAVSYENNPAYAARAEPAVRDEGTVDARGAAAILSGRGLY